MPVKISYGIKPEEQAIVDLPELTVGHGLVLDAGQLSISGDVITSATSYKVVLPIENLSHPPDLMGYSNKDQIYVAVLHMGSWHKIKLVDLLKMALS